MNLQVTELKIGKVSPAEINWNYAEMKASLVVALEDYKNLVVTEETLKAAKDVMAYLNKEAKKVDDFRKETKNKLNPEIKKFDGEANELYKMIKEARTIVSNQTEIFILKAREEKKVVVKCAINSVSHEIELKEKYLVQVELKDQYFNSSMTINKVTEDLRIQFNQLLQEQTMEQQKIDTIKAIVDTFNHQLEFKFDPKEFDYLLDQDIPTISETVNQKVKSRVSAEKAKIELMEFNKKEAIRLAEEKVKKDADDLAEKTRIETENKHREELRKVGIDKQQAVAKVEAEKQAVLFATEEVLETVDAITPTEAVEDSGGDPVMIELNFSVLETPERLETLKNYLDQFDYQYCIEGE